MAKRLNPNLAKIHRNYTVEEVANLFTVHKNTVRSWIKEGLVLNDSKRPILILGSSLRDFLQAKRESAKRKCLPHEIYCLRCKTPKRPAENMVDFKVINSSVGCLIGLCPSCNTVINKYLRIDQIQLIFSKLDVMLPEALKHIIESTNPLLNSDFNQ
jgi:hypothetical protein